MKNEYDIKLKENVQPVVHPPRKIPLVLKEKVKRTLDKMSQQGIICPVEEGTDWVSSLVVVSKPDKLRICIDPKDLNRAIMRPHYPIPTVEEMIPDLAGAKVFSVFDAKDGFWQIKLSERSSYLTTFNTPYGRYRWLRMPFGISSGSEEF